MIRRTIKHRRNRRQLDPSQPATPRDAVPTTLDTTGVTIEVTFDMPMVLGPFLADGDPMAITAGGDVLLSATQTSPSLWVLIFNGAPGVAPMIVPQDCPTFRTGMGGYIQAGSYPTT